jgi:hypothetical protein
LPHEIITRWRSLSLNSAPFVLSGDEVLAQNELAHPPYSFGEFVDSPAFESPGNRFHLGLLPIPFVGDLERATIYILLLNPGFSPDDYFGEERVPEYREALCRNLQQRLEDSTYPFYCLDPRFSWHAGFTYWHGRLRGIAVQLARVRNIRYQEALAELARSICALELVPYHSAYFKLPDRVLSSLASVRLAQAFVQDFVLPKIISSEATVIVTRSARYWDLPSGADTVVYQGGETRGAFLSPNTRGGAAILRRLAMTDPPIA